MNTSTISTTTTSSIFIDEYLFNKIFNENIIENRERKIYSILNNTEYIEKSLKEYDDYKKISLNYLINKLGQSYVFDEVYNPFYPVKKIKYE